MNKKFNINWVLIITLVCVVIFILIEIFFYKNLLRLYNGVFHLINKNKPEDISNLALAFFQAQATITTIGIALLAFISKDNNKKIYGILISEYLMYYTKGLLSNNNIIKELLLIVLLNSIIVFLHLYFTFFVLFFITIILLFYLYQNILYTFQASEKLKEEIKEFFLNKLKTNEIKLNSIMEKEKNINTESLYEREIVECFVNWYYQIKEFFLNKLKTNEIKLNSIMEKEIKICMKSLYKRKIVDCFINWYYQIEESIRNKEEIKEFFLNKLKTNEIKLNSIKEKEKNINTESLYEKEIVKYLANWYNQLFESIRNNDKTYLRDLWVTKEILNNSNNINLITTLDDFNSKTVSYLYDEKRFDELSAMVIILLLSPYYFVLDEENIYTYEFYNYFDYSEIILNLISDLKNQNEFLYSYCDNIIDLICAYSMYTILDINNYIPNKKNTPTKKLIEIIKEYIHAIQSNKYFNSENKNHAFSFIYEFMEKYQGTKNIHHIFNLQRIYPNDKYTFIYEGFCFLSIEYFEGYKKGKQEFDDIMKTIENSSKLEDIPEPFQTVSEIRTKLYNLMKERHMDPLSRYNIQRNNPSKVSEAETTNNSQNNEEGNINKENKNESK